LLFFGRLSAGPVAAAAGLGTPWAIRPGSVWERGVEECRERGERGKMDCGAGIVGENIFFEQKKH